MKLSVLVRLFIALALLYGTTLPLTTVWIAFSFFIPFIPPHIFQRFSDFLTSIILRLLLFMTETYTGTKLILHGDAKRIFSQKERAICLSNHQSSVDWLIFCMLAARQGSLGHVRFLLKHSIQYFPIFGFIFYLGGNIFINRKSFKEQKMLSSLKYLQTKKIPSWISIYPEGTRFNVRSSEVLSRSQKMFIDQGFIPLNHVLFPKYRGFHMILNNLRNHMDAVYDITIAFSNTKGDRKGDRLEAPSFSEYLGSTCDSVHVHINRIGVNNVPTEEEEVKQWLYNTFKEKDKLLTKFYNSDDKVEEHPFGKGTEAQPNVLKNTFTFLMLTLSSISLLFTSTGRAVFLPGLLLLSIIGYIWKLYDILVYKFITSKRS